MPQYDREKDEVRVFDGGEDDDDQEGSHLPVVIFIAFLVLAAFGGVVWLAYNQGVARGRGDVPVRLATTETVQNGGQNQIKVFQQPAGAEDDNASAPAVTQPAAASSPPSAQSPAPKPVQTAEASTEPPPPAALAPAKPQPPAPAPQVASKPPAQLGLAHPAPPPEPAATTPPVTATAVTPPAPKPSAVAPAPKPAVVSAGGYALQIGAYKSQDEAMAAWKTYRAKHATLLAGFSPDVQRADLGDKGVWFRLRVTPFSDKAAAVALCDRLKAESGACFLAR